MAEKKRDFIIVGSGAPEALKMVMELMFKLDPASVIHFMEGDEPKSASAALMDMPETNLQVERALLMERVHSTMDICVLSVHDTPQHTKISEAILGLQIERKLSVEDLLIEKKPILMKPSANPFDRENKSKKCKKQNKHKL